MSHGNLQDWLELGDALGIESVSGPPPLDPMSSLWPAEGYYHHGDVGAGPHPDEALGRLDSDVRLLTQEVDAQAPPMFDAATVQGLPRPGTRYGWPDYASVSGYGEVDHMAGTARHRFPLARVGETPSVAQTGIGQHVPGATPRYKAWSEMRAQWGAFAVEWDAWRQRAESLFGLSDKERGELEKFIDRFNGWRKKWTDFGIRTQTSVQEQPAGSWWDRNWGKVAFLGGVVGLVLLAPSLVAVAGLVGSSKAAAGAAAL